MIKRILKAIFKGIAGIALLIAIAYGGFHFWEYSTGGKYISYLSENSETVPLSQSFTFDKLDNDIKDNLLILVGEIHGFEEPQKFDYELFTHLHAKHGVRQYYAELDFVQATLMNKYLESGDETLLQETLARWVVVQGRNNKDYYDKYKKLHDYYKQQADENKFSFIGVDRIQDLQLTAKFINSLLPASGNGIEISTKTEDLMNQLQQLDTIYKDATDTLFMLAHIKSNVKYISEKKNRESVMFENFRTLYQKFNNEKLRAYGYFGLYHVFQYQVNGQQPLAAQIRTADLGLDNKILSMNFLMVDSYMVMPSAQLPEFMRDKGSYTKMPISSDVMLFMYIVGIKDFKRMTHEYHKS
jgi:hypothetical protein